MNRTVIAAIGAFAISCSTLTAQIPQLINYQGRVVVGTTNFDGNGSFKFALVNAAGTTAYWTNDGTHLDGTEPNAAVSLAVAKGLYSVLLGDMSLTNMTAVPASVFNNSDVRLRVWFDDGTHGSQLLTPDQRIASVGYAVMAGNVADGAITSAKIANGAVGSTQLASGAVTNTQIDTATVQQRVTGSAPNGQFIQSINADGTVVTAADTNSGGTVTSVATGGGLTGGPVTSSGTISVDNTIPRLSTANTFTNSNYFNGANVGIGTTSPVTKLEVRGTEDASPEDLFRLSKNTFGSSIFTQSYTDAGNWGFTLHGSSGPSNAFKFNMASGRFGIGTNAPEAKLDVNGDIAIAPTTSSTVGVIKQNGSSLLHTFGTDNFFAGSGAGNFTTTGNRNTADGFNALAHVTSGGGNTAAGYQALTTVTTGNSNTATGHRTLETISTGSNNTAYGDTALLNTTTGNFNIAIGLSAGINLTSGDNNIDIGNAGVTAETNIIRIGTPGTQTDTFLTGIIHGDGSGLTGISASEVTGTITGAQIANGAVGNTQLATSAVTNANIASGTIDNTKLANSAITVTAGSGLSGGGIVALGGSVTLSNTSVYTAGSGLTLSGTIFAVDSSIVPRLSAANTFTNSNYFTGGNVGIGTASPSEQLHVANNARIDGAAYSTAFESFPSATDGNSVSVRAGRAGGGWSSLINSLSASSGGNLTLSAGGAGHGGHGGDVSIEAGSAFDTGSIGGSVFLKAGGLSAWTRGYIGFFTGGDYPADFNTPVERMRLTDAGNLGIGTTTPVAKLDVNGNIAIAGTPVIDANGNWVGNPIAAGGASINPLQVALLKWAPNSAVSFSAGNGPFGIAFDGANLWVADNAGDNVTKLRANDGAAVGTFSVGSSPYGIAFDGANVWTANAGGNVTKLRASDGAIQGTFTAGTTPIGIAFDGTNIWVANFNSANVTKLRASDGAPQGTFAVGTNPQGVAFDGTNIWVANSGSNNVTKLRASDGAVQGTFAAGTSPAGVAFDGANIWLANRGSNNITKLRASDGGLIGTYSVGTNPNGVAFDGLNIWVTNQGSNTVTKLRASDGTLQGAFSVGNGPAAAAFDGANIWVTNLISNTVSKL